MKKKYGTLLIITALLSCIPARAEIIRRTPEEIFAKVVDLPAKYSNLGIDAVSMTEIPTLLEINESPCAELEQTCPARSRILESTPVVQIRAHYLDFDTPAENNIVFFDIQFPLNEFNDTELSLIRSTSGANMVRKLARKLVNFTVSSTMEPVEVIDFDKSDCHLDVENWRYICEKPVYKTILSRINRVQFKRP
jgi:hypothetical protein